LSKRLINRRPESVSVAVIALLAWSKTPSSSRSSIAVRSFVRSIARVPLAKAAETLRL
jgi:hypothetical protein